MDPVSSESRCPLTQSHVALPRHSATLCATARRRSARVAGRLGAFDASDLFCFFNDTAPTEIYTLPLHDALPIYLGSIGFPAGTGPTRSRAIALTSLAASNVCFLRANHPPHRVAQRSEEHTSEL